MATLHRLIVMGLAGVTAAPAVSASPFAGDGTLLGTWTYQQVLNNGLDLGNVFRGATWETRVNTSLGTGFLYVLNADVSLNDGDLIRAGSFVYYKSNPVLNYSFAITDNGLPSSFGFRLTSAIVPPTVGLHDVRVDFGAIVSDGDDANDTASFTALAPVGIPVDGDGLPEAQVLTFKRVIDAPGTRINAGYDLGQTFNVVAFGASIEGPLLDQRNFLSAWDEWQFDLNFAGSGGGDAYAVNGRAQITWVPVPAALWLLGSAVCGVSLLRRRA